MQHTASSNRPQSETLSEDEKRTILALVEKHGERVIILLLGVCRQTLARGLGGLRIQRGSASLIREGLVRAPRRGAP